MDDIFGFSEKDTTRITNAVTHFETRPETATPRDDVREMPRRRAQITLDEDLAGTEDYDAPTSGRATIKTGLSGLDSLGSIAETIIVWNRFPTEYTAGDFAHAVEVIEDNRWYMVGGGSGGGKIIEFTIDSVNCPGDGYWNVIVDSYSGGCTAPSPGEDSYGFVEVRPNCLSPYSQAELEASGTGTAVYMYPRTGYCEPYWLELTSCAVVECLP